VQITVGELIRQLQSYDKEAWLQFGSGPRGLDFYRLKQRGSLPSGNGYSSALRDRSDIVDMPHADIVPLHVPSVLAKGFQELPIRSA
jgi:hypothetical protein